MDYSKYLVEFNKIYDEVKSKYPLPDYSKKVDLKNACKVLNRFYQIQCILKKHKVYDYLEYDEFKLLFVKMVFDGTVENIEANFEFLRDLYIDYGIDFFSNYRKLVNLFSFRNYSLINCSLSIVEMSHFLVSDAVYSEKAIEQFGEAEQFPYILDKVASNDKYPELFFLCFPLINTGIYTDISKKLADEVSFSNAIHISNEVVIAEATNKTLSSANSSLMNLKIKEDFDFFKELYSGKSNDDLLKFFQSMISHDCFYTLKGSFRNLYRRLDSINANVFNGQFDIYDYFLNVDKVINNKNNYSNIDLFNDIIVNLKSFFDYRDFKNEKKLDYDTISTEIVGEFTSKFFFYSSLFKLNGNFQSYYRLCNGKESEELLTGILKYLAQIKKDELDGLITREDAISRFNNLFECINPIGICSLNDENKKSIKNLIDLNVELNIFLTNECNKCSIDDKVIPAYLMLTDDYFKNGKSVYLDLDDFISYAIKVKSNGKDEIGKLIDIDPNLSNLFRFNYQPNNFVQDYSFMEDLNPCAAYDFKQYDMFNPNLGINDVNKMFDAMAVRYHSRIKFCDYRNFVNERNVEKGIYKLKELFKNGYLTWDKDRIHVYNYFLYLENNLAHDISENVIDYYLKNFDYFSPSLNKEKQEINNVKNKIKKLYHCDDETALNFICSEIEKKDFNNNNLLSNSSFSKKCELIIKYIGLLQEQSLDFKFKAAYAEHIIIDFYTK